MNDNNASSGLAGDSGNDREAQLREENELLRMKIIAQFGGAPGELSDIPPEVANQFLRNVIAYEEHYAQSVNKTVKVAARLGAPQFRKSAELDDNAFATEWKRLQQLLEEHAMIIDFIRPRDERFQYTFITGELFEHETDEGASLPGMIRHFTYEDFHPDHEQEIHDRMMEFLKAWFDRHAESLAYTLGTAFIQPDTEILSRSTLLNKVQYIFDAYTGFHNCRYHVSEVRFELKEDEQLQGIGHAEGMAKYDALTEQGEMQTFEGPFKLYMTRESDWWSIFYFVMPGFE